MVENIDMENASHEVVITLDGRDVRIPMDNIGISIESTEREIIDAVRPVVQEEHQIDIDDENGRVSFTVRKAINSDTIYVYPKPVMG